MHNKPHSQKAKDKISKAKTGKALDPEVVAKRPKFRISIEKQDALAEAYKSGKNLKDIALEHKVSLQTIYKVAGDRGILKIGNFYKAAGKEHSEETKEKISASQKETWTERKISNNE